jgi:hypothetical protein
VQRKPAANLLIVLTDGTLVWDEVTGDFDWEQTPALPPSLRGAFTEEPRYIDLRWARTEDHVSLHSPPLSGVCGRPGGPAARSAKDDLVARTSASTAVPCDWHARRSPCWPPWR